MKTEIKQYLKKTSKHLFTNKENGKYFKVKFDGDSDTFTTIESNGISPNIIRTHNINSYIEGYGINAKCVIKHSLFLNKKFLSVKRSKNILMD